MKVIRRHSARTLVLAALAVTAVVASVAAGVAPNPGPGFHLGYEDGQVVVESVDYGGPAALTGLHPGAVVSWLNDRYVLAMSDQDKRAIAASPEPVRMLMTTGRDQIGADLATYTKLVGVARQSDLPWLANPETYPVPDCYLDNSCAPFRQHTEPDGSTWLEMIYWSWDGGELCMGTDGSQISVQPGEPAPTGSFPVTSAASAQFCVLGSASPSAGPSYGYFDPSDAWYSDYMWLPYGRGSDATVLGMAILLLGWLFVGRGWAGSALRPYALTLPLATAMPLLAVPMDRYPSPAALVAGSILVPLAMFPLAIDFLGRIDGRRRRALVGLATLGLAVGSAICGLLTPTSSLAMYVWRAFLAGCVPFVPGLVAARPFHRSESASRSGSGWGRGWWRRIAAGAVATVPGPYASRWSRRIGAAAAASSKPSPLALVERTDLLLASMTPGIAAICLTSPYSFEIGPLVLWLAGLPIAIRLIVRPLGRLATSAVRQRDLVVAATEAERTRIAADIHDFALQDLTMLVRRLDAGGDAANAQAAREVAERLRSICGDLRLPVLDDLGVGPALEWLCDRLSAGTDPIVLDRLGGEARLPVDVELAAFRVAQEALSNAVRHGAPPIVVRYRAREAWMELEVDDAGSGIEAGAPEAAEQTGHLGLLNMTQRAEAVGANLSIRERPGGGTRVSLVWDRDGAPAPVLSPSPA